MSHFRTHLQLQEMLILAVNKLKEYIFLPLSEIFFLLLFLKHLAIHSINVWAISI